MYVSMYACVCVCGLCGIQKFHTRLRNCIKTYQITLKFSYSKSSSNVVAAAAVKRREAESRTVALSKGSAVVERIPRKILIYKYIANNCIL